MIIVCPSCEKNFEVDSNIIPEKGRLVKCGSCDQTWFFNKNSQVNINNKKIDIPIINVTKKTSSKSLNKKEKTLDKDTSIISKNNKGSELVKYQAKSNFTFGKFLGYLVVTIVSFVALIIILDTFKGPLNVFFPNLELILYNLFETLKDLLLFIKDLN